MGLGVSRVRKWDVSMPLLTAETDAGLGYQMVGAQAFDGQQCKRRVSRAYAVHVPGLRSYVADVDGQFKYIARR